MGREYICQKHDYVLKLLSDIIFLQLLEIIAMM